LVRLKLRTMLEGDASVLGVARMGAVGNRHYPRMVKKASRNMARATACFSFSFLITLI
jgi:hypothetical protein